MADLAAVESALVQTIVSALFPAGGYVEGTYAASTPAAGAIVSVFRGWPTSAVLDADLLAGRAQISVFSESGMTRLTTRYAPTWQQITAAVPSVTATVSGLTLTLAGTVKAGDVVGMQIGAGKLKSGYSYRFTGTDTLATAAAALAARVSGATSSGGVVTLPAGTLGLSAAVVTDQQAQIEVRRQAQGIRVSCWCPTPQMRDALVGLVDAAFAGLTDASGRFTQFLTLADGGSALLTYRATYTDDTSGRDRLWRRDLCYTAEYGTTLTQTQPELLFLVENVTAQGQTAASFGTTDSP